MQVLPPPQKFERHPILNGWSYGIKTDGVEVTFNGMTSLQNLKKSSNWFKSYWGGGQEGVP
jgi:hypothetical protein